MYCFRYCFSLNWSTSASHCLIHVKTSLQSSNLAVPTKLFPFFLALNLHLQGLCYFSAFAVQYSHHTTTFLRSEYKELPSPNADIQYNMLGSRFNSKVAVGILYFSDIYLTSIVIIWSPSCHSKPGPCTTPHCIQTDRITINNRKWVSYSFHFQG